MDVSEDVFRIHGTEPNSAGIGFWLIRGGKLDERFFGLSFSWPPDPKLDVLSKGVNLHHDVFVQGTEIRRHDPPPIRVIICGALYCGSIAIVAQVDVDIVGVVGITVGVAANVRARSAVMRVAEKIS